MELTHAERLSILRGDKPRIERPFIDGEEPPFIPGEEVVLKSLMSLAGPVPQVSITVTRCRRSKKGEWVASYSLRDDRPIYVSRQPGYTRSADQSIDAEAPVLDESTEKRFEMEARTARAEARLEREEKREKRRKQEVAVREKLRHTLKGLEQPAAIELLASIEREITRAGMEQAA